MPQKSQFETMKGSTDCTTEKLESIFPYHVDEDFVLNVVRREEGLKQQGNNKATSIYYKETTHSSPATIHGRERPMSKHLSSSHEPSASTSTTVPDYMSSSPSSTCNGQDISHMRFISRLSCELLHKPDNQIALIAGLLLFAFIFLLCIARWWIKIKRRKNRSRRYLDTSEYAAIASEYDELLEGVFENDEFTNYQDDYDDDDSIGSILTEWSGDHAAEMLRNGTELEMQTFDIDLGGDAVAGRRSGGS